MDTNKKARVIASHRGQERKSSAVFPQSIQLTLYGGILGTIASLLSLDSVQGRGSTRWPLGLGSLPLGSGAPSSTRLRTVPLCGACQLSLLPVAVVSEVTIVPDKNLSAPV